MTSSLPAPVDPEATDGPGADDELAYLDAVAELDEILEALSAETVDVDALADRVHRAHQLITLCRRRIDASRVEVEQIAALLDD